MSDARAANLRQPDNFPFAHRQAVWDYLAL